MQKNSVIRRSNLIHTYGLLTKFARSRWLDIGLVLFLRVYGPRRSLLGQDGWILASFFFASLWTETKFSFFFCEFMDRDEVEVHNLAKKERGQYPAILTEQTWSIKDLLGSPERARWLHLARSGSQSQRAIWVILPARGASHITNMGYCPRVRSRWLHIGQVLFLRVYGPRRSRGPQTRKKAERSQDPAILTKKLSQ